MAGKRHASEEIAAKLAQANEMAAKGKTQRDISRALGVSVMTYHRWRKMRGGEAKPHTADALSFRPQEIFSESQPQALAEDLIRQLELENSRLRRLVTDLLLEKLKLDDELRARNEARFRKTP